MAFQGGGGESSGEEAENHPSKIGLNGVIYDTDFFLAI